MRNHGCVGGYAQRPAASGDAPRGSKRVAFPEAVVVDALLRPIDSEERARARHRLDEAVNRLVRLRTGRGRALDASNRDDRALLESLLASLDDADLMRLRTLAQDVLDEDFPHLQFDDFGDGSPFSLDTDDLTFSPIPGGGGPSGSWQSGRSGRSWARRLNPRAWVESLRADSQPPDLQRLEKEPSRLPARPGREADVVLRAGGNDGRQEELDPYTPLKTGARVEVVVRIGAPFNQSIFSGRRPDIDALLGPSATLRELTVSLLSSDFKVVSESPQNLELPADGQSREVRFTVVAPPKPTTSTARLFLHYRGNVVQTVRITAIVRRRRRRLQARAVWAAVEHVAPGGLPAVRGLRPRAVSLVLNKSSADVHMLYTHTKDGDACPLALPTAVLDAARDTRATLEQAMRTGDYDQAIRELAARGSNLWRYLFDQTPVREEVRALLRATDETVQVLRVDPDSSLPWALVYDRLLPADTGGLPVCRDFACTHADEGAQVCLNGFWGIRLRIEELLADRAGAPLEAVAVGANGPPVFLATAVVDAFSSDLPNHLTPLSVAPLPVAAWPPDPALVDALWGPQRQPVCVVVAHHERVAGGGTVKADSVLRSQNGELILSASKLSETAGRRGDWQDPRPLVVLLGCSTTAPPTGQDLGGFLSAMLGARASGVIGTECTLNTISLPIIAEALSQALRAALAPDGAANVLPVAAQDMRRSLAAAGDITGLAVTAVGSFCAVTAS